jgi:hypothetical protein
MVARDLNRSTRAPPRAATPRLMATTIYVEPETTPRGGTETQPGGDCTILGGIHTQSTTLHMCRRPRRFARGARRFITRCDALGARERDCSIATDRVIVATRRLRPSARCVARRERSSHRADRSCVQAGARGNRCERSSFHSVRRSRRTLAFPRHGDQWAMHVDTSSHVTDASSPHAGASDTRCVRSSLQCDRSRTRICRLVLADVRFVSSSRRFI